MGLLSEDGTFVNATHGACLRAYVPALQTVEAVPGSASA